MQRINKNVLMAMAIFLDVLCITFLYVNIHLNVTALHDGPSWPLTNDMRFSVNCKTVTVLIVVCYPMKQTLLEGSKYNSP